VYENLFFSALFRSEDGTSVEHITELVNETLKVLLLDHIRDSIVGSVEKRGISGGQRKRVNIGLEIVAEPALIFLDEPTSGLDATSSQLIMGALAKLGEIGITTASVIHQPRYDVFCGFSLLFLLGKGGKMVYQGPPKASKDYFEMIGFEMQSTDNLADFVCDVTCDSVPRKDFPEFTPSDLFDLWKEHGDAFGESNALERKVSKAGKLTVDGMKNTRGFLQQLVLQFRKEGLKRWRNRVTIMTEWALCGMVVLLGAIMVGAYESGAGGNIFDIETSILITLLLYTLIVSYIFARTFTVDKLIFWRESGRGYHISAFFIANLAMDMLTVLISSSLAASLFTDFRQPWVDGSFVWTWFFILTWGMSGWSYFFSTVFPLKLATISTLLSNTFLQVLVSGTVPFLKPMQIVTTLPFLGFLSSGFMAADSYIVSFANQFPPQYGVGNIALSDRTRMKKGSMWGYAWYDSPNNIAAPEDVLEYRFYHWEPLYIIIAQGMILRILAFALLYVSNRGAMGKPALFEKPAILKGKPGPLDPPTAGREKRRSILGHFGGSMLFAYTNPDEEGTSLMSRFPNIPSLSGLNPLSRSMEKGSLGDLELEPVTERGNEEMSDSDASLLQEDPNTSSSVEVGSFTGSVRSESYQSDVHAAAEQPGLGFDGEASLETSTGSTGNFATPPIPGGGGGPQVAEQQV
jgi:ABC-type multidrug transport system ATPase subunit